MPTSLLAILWMLNTDRHEVPMDLLIKTAMAHLGTPYKWGGSNPVEGFDCSGFMQWLLKSAGLDQKGDQTAQALYDQFIKTGSVSSDRPGTLVFYGKSVAEITHVAMMLDRYRVIEAGGGGRLTMTVADAAHASACVRVRHITGRQDIVAKVRPDYATIGVTQ
jgi:cell wall-associated NlpC family hydrolase